MKTWSFIIYEAYVVLNWCALVCLFVKYVYDLELWCCMNVFRIYDILGVDVVSKIWSNRYEDVVGIWIPKKNENAPDLRTRSKIT
jgi:hypothetical protein